MENFKKRFLVVFIILAIILTACSNGSYKIINGDLDFQKDYVSGSYEEFNGYQSKYIEFEEENIVVFNLNVKTEKGLLEVKVLDSEDQVILKMNSVIKEQKKELRIAKTEKYKVKIIGNNHKGEFELNWDLKDK